MIATTTFILHLISEFTTKTIAENDFFTSFKIIFLDLLLKVTPSY